MKIQILGGGCRNCNNLEKNTKEALDKLGIEIKIEKVTDVKEITALGVMRTPALMVDGKVLVSGRVAKPREIIKMLG
ncbi:MAG: thioredoxin family protein [Clostridia bacterium]|nr:thioredoxin family protein [Clostridia bacterium]